MSYPTMEDDLRELLAAQGGTGPADTGRLGTVRRRVARRRRARFATAGLAVLVVAVGVPLGVVLAARPERAAPAAVAAPTAAELPTYSTGFRKLTERRVDIATTTSFELTFTPRSWAFSLAANCRSTAVASLSVRVKGAAAGSTGPVGLGCGPGTGNTLDLSPQRTVTPDDRRDGWRHHGVARIDRPVTLIATIGLGSGETTAPPGRLHGGAVLAVYEEVPFEQYPLPARPAVLPDLDTLTRGPDGMVHPDRTVDPGPPSQPIGTLDSRTLSGPNGTFALQVPLPSRLRCVADSVAPGELRFAVAGRPGLTSTFWEWRGTSLDAVGSDDPAVFGLHAGDPVTITVTALHFTDPAWRLRCFTVDGNG
ncbi:hypothetical protein F4553_007439 [Allocatelliglobosispora scoriae]|uniref:Uncharacterized protein n=1 Tax=Allocatelliglobosispora scoriae TaxID=643052 RepID=A0A841C255_9ACTN|nr:hypothetical protein [Allocatelliglobosispora scoriae]MBB5874005.1 hypothetical protein [Allocatelliglobosispora scoriae]